MKKVSIIDLGSIKDEEKVLKRAKKAIADALSMNSEFFFSMEVPDSAFNGRRKQYRSPDLLEIVSEESRGNIGLGLTELDLYSSNLNFVFGQASSVTDSAVVSLHRLRPSFYGLEDEDIFLERLGKEAVHEVGHVLGLSHCDNSDCVMYFSNNILSVDSKGDKLCSNCHNKFKKIY